MCVVLYITPVELKLCVRKRVIASWKRLVSLYTTTGVALYIIHEELCVTIGEKVIRIVTTAYQCYNYMTVSFVSLETSLASMCLASTAFRMATGRGWVVFIRLEGNTFNAQ